MYRLREIIKDDIIIINQWRNNKDLIDQLGTTFRFINLDVDIDWYENYMKNRSSTVRCSIIDESNSLIGLVSLTNIDFTNQKSIFHIMIGEAKHRGKGAGLFAITEILKHAFKNLNLNRIELTVLQNNLHAINLYKKVGFIEEGIIRHCIYKNGKFENMLLMSVLKKDFNY